MMRGKSKFSNFRDLLFRDLRLSINLNDRNMGVLVRLLEQIEIEFKHKKKIKD